MIERMVFTGTDGSLGYRTGRTYTLDVDTRPDGFLWARPATDPDARECPYSSLASFLANWRPLEDSRG